MMCSCIAMSNRLNSAPVKAFSCAAMLFSIQRLSSEVQRMAANRAPMDSRAIRVSRISAMSFFLQDPDASPPGRLELNQAGAFQLDHGFTHRSTADAKAFCQHRLRESFTRLESA
jgi:hypothetical protein